VRGDRFVDSVGVRAIRHTHVDVRVFEPEARIYVRCNLVISPENVKQIDIDKVVEGVNVLLDKPLDFQESRE